VTLPYPHNNVEFFDISRFDNLHSASKLIRLWQHTLIVGLPLSFKIQNKSLIRPAGKIWLFVNKQTQIFQQFENEVRYMGWNFTDAFPGHTGMQQLLHNIVTTVHIKGSMITVVSKVV